MNDLKNEATVKNKKVVSVKLDSSTQTKLEQDAAKAGLSVSDYQRKLINDAGEQNKVPESATVVTLHPAVIENIVSVLSKVVADSAPQQIEVSIPVNALPEREFLRKISGLKVESVETLSVQEENYLTELNEAIKATARERFLMAENSILFPFIEFTPLQKKTFIEMVKIREELQDEKTPSFTKVFQDAVLTSFVEDANELYRSHKFKAVYGFEHKEFEAIFEL